MPLAAGVCFLGVAPVPCPVAGSCSPPGTLGRGRVFSLGLPFSPDPRMFPFFPSPLGGSSSFWGFSGDVTSFPPPLGGLSVSWGALSSLPGVSRLSLGNTDSDCGTPTKGTIIRISGWL